MRVRIIEVDQLSGEETLVPGEYDLTECGFESDDPERGLVERDLLAGGEAMVGGGAAALFKIVLVSTL